MLVFWFVVGFGIGMPIVSAAVPLCGVIAWAIAGRIRVLAAWPWVAQIALIDLLFSPLFTILGDAQVGPRPGHCVVLWSTPEEFAALVVPPVLVYVLACGLVVSLLRRGASSVPPARPRSLRFLRIQATLALGALGWASLPAAFRWAIVSADQWSRWPVQNAAVIVGLGLSAAYWTPLWRLLTRSPAPRPVRPSPRLKITYHGRQLY